MKAKPSIPPFATFGEMLHYLRRSARLTQRELAIATGYSESMISRLEHDDRPPDVATILALFAPALDIQDQPAVVAQLVGLAQSARREAAHAGQQPPELARLPFTAPHRLPARLTSFVGRAGDLLAVARLLAQGRLVMLTGPGGCGKTSLAVETARRLAEAGKPAAEQSGNDTALALDDIYLVELLPLSDPDLLAQTILTGLGLEGNPEQQTQQTLIGYLADRRALLVLDNCEHLVDSVALLVEALLRSCPNLRILATSRERLNIGAETVYAVGSLAFPEAAAPWGPAQAADYPAVQLFVERTQAITPGFHLHAHNMSAVLRICELLEGLPLALELAAAATAIFSVAEIAQQLDARLLLAGPGYRTADPRHRQLRDTVEWSYRLLSPAEQRMLVHLAVFAGGWTLDALHHVLGNEAPGNENGCVVLLHQLVRKSLVRAEQQTLSVGSRTRFQLLRAIREFAAERLVADEEQDVVGRRHFNYYAQLAMQWGAQVLGPRHRQAMAELDGDYHNIRAAARFSLDKPDLAEPRIRLAAALPNYWRLRQSRLSVEGNSWLRTALDVEAPYSVASRAQAYAALLSLNGKDLYGCGVNADYTLPRTQQLIAAADTLVALNLAHCDRGQALHLLLTLAEAHRIPADIALCREYTQRALDLLDEQTGDTRAVGLAGNLLAWLELQEGQLEAARTRCEDNFRTLAQSGLPLALCEIYWLQSTLARQTHNQAEQIHYLRLQLELAEREGFATYVHGGYYELEQIDAPLAKRLAEELLERQRGQSNGALLGLALHQLGRMCVHDQQFERANGLLDEAIAIWRQNSSQGGLGSSLQWVLIDRGRASHFLRDHTTAIACYDESIALFAASPYSVFSAYPLLYRGHTRLAQGDLHRAATDYHHCIKTTAQDLSGCDYLAIRALAGTAELASQHGDWAFSGKLFGAVAALDAVCAAPTAQARFAESYEFLCSMAAAAEHRRSPAFEAAWQEGGRLTLEEAVALVLEQ